MLPFARMLQYGGVVRRNTIISYFEDYTSSTVKVSGSALYDPSPFFYTNGYNAVRFMAAPSKIEIGTGGIPAALVIGDSTDFVIQGYVYLTGTSTQMLIGNLINGTGTGSFWVTLNNTFGVSSQISLDGYSTTGAVQRFRFGTTGSTKIPTDTWVHIKLERVGTNLSFYIDNVQVGASQSMTLGFMNTSSNILCIGSSVDNTYQLLGAIDSFTMSTSSSTGDII